MAGRRRRSYYSDYIPSVGRYVRRRKRGGLAEFGQAESMRDAFESVKDVLITGGIAAGGAIVTEKVWAMIGGKMGLKPDQEDLAIVATGIGLGMLISKLTKKPRIGAAFAVGPVVLGLMKLFSRLVAGTTLTGLGVVQIEPPGLREQMTQLPVKPVSAAQIDTTVPDWMLYGQEPPVYGELVQ